MDSMNHVSKWMVGVVASYFFNCNFENEQNCRGTVFCFFCILSTDVFCRILIIPCDHFMLCSLYILL